MNFVIICLNLINSYVTEGKSVLFFNPSTFLLERIESTVIFLLCLLDNFSLILGVS